VQNAVRDLIRAGVVVSAHDCSEGGLAVALAECCFNPDQLFGANVKLSQNGCATLFGESQSCIVISVKDADLAKVRASLTSAKIPFSGLGQVGGTELRINIATESYFWPIQEIHDLWFNSITRAVGGDSSERIPSL